MQYDTSVGDCPADIWELFADLFESVYNVDTCDSDTEDLSDPSDDCVFSSRHLSSKWKDSFLIHIFKTSKRNDIGNYRGVAILSCFAKLFEVTVYDYIFFSVKPYVCSRAGQL
jgi:hypothetical protein